MALKMTGRRTGTQTSIKMYRKSTSKIFSLLFRNFSAILLDFWSLDPSMKVNALQADPKHLDSIPGIASFNMTTNEWSNDTTPDNAANTFLVGLEHYGPNGLLISSGSAGIGAQSQSLDNITIYEPMNKTWHVQNTTGNAPLIRAQPCVVSNFGDNGTYEM